MHCNDSDAFHAGGWPIHEATSSGAAARDAASNGRRRRTFGLLAADARQISFGLFADKQLEQCWSRKISRATWLPAQAGPGSDDSPAAQQPA